MRYNDARGANIKLDMVVRCSVCKSTNPNHYTPSLKTNLWVCNQRRTDRQTDGQRKGNASEQAIKEASKHSCKQAKTDKHELEIASLSLHVLYIYISKHILTYMHVYLYIYTLNIRRCMFAFHQPGHLSTL